MDELDTLTISDPSNFTLQVETADSLSIAVQPNRGIELSYMPSQYTLLIAGALNDTEIQDETIMIYLDNGRGKLCCFFIVIVLKFTFNLHSQLIHADMNRFFNFY